MIKNDYIINSLIHENVIEKLSKIRNISIKEAKSIISSMTFGQYKDLLEEPIVPPSGNPITAPQPQKSVNAQKAPTKNIKAIWPGSNAPVEVGMAVGIKDAKGLPANAVVTQVDKSAKGVKARNPQGKEEWYNMNTLQPGMAMNKDTQKTIEATKPSLQSRIEDLKARKQKNKQEVEWLRAGLLPHEWPEYDEFDDYEKIDTEPTASNVRRVSGTYGTKFHKYQKPEPENSDDLENITDLEKNPELEIELEPKEPKIIEELMRLKQLAGISETCSAGASGAGSVAVGVVEMGKGNVIRRQTNSEKKYSREYTPESAPKTIVGDTKPNQASGELSTKLVQKGKKTASRKNNGFKK